mmetsp:Transcript_14388/g.41196  ORF Transcript_14388/g.41196 Transcript_14388/m.41196 type:complete len:204 (-) Transcript_14388:34-645(-)
MQRTPTAPPSSFATPWALWRMTWASRSCSAWRSAWGTLVWCATGRTATGARTTRTRSATTPPSTSRTRSSRSVTRCCSQARRRSGACLTPWSAPTTAGSIRSTRSQSTSNSSSCSSAGLSPPSQATSASTGLGCAARPTTSARARGCPTTTRPSSGRRWTSRWHFTRWRKASPEGSEGSAWLRQGIGCGVAVVQVDRVDGNDP